METSSEQLVNRSKELAKAVESFQKELGVSRRTTKLEARADKTDQHITRSLLMKKIIFPGLVVLMVFTGVDAYLGHQLSTLVHTECVRSQKGAELRNKLIDGLTEHVATPIPGSPQGLIDTVKERNRQLDVERHELQVIGSKIPNVEC